MCIHLIPACGCSFMASSDHRKYNPLVWSTPHYPSSPTLPTPPPRFNMFFSNGALLLPRSSKWQLTKTTKLQQLVSVIYAISYSIFPLFIRNLIIEHFLWNCGFIILQAGPGYVVIDDEGGWGRWMIGMWYAFHFHPLNGRIAGFRK